MLLIWKRLTQVLIGSWLVFTVTFSHAGLFDDDEARKAILDLRQKVEANKQQADATKQALDANKAAADASKAAQDAANAEQKRTTEENSTALRKSLLDLQNQIEFLRVDIARLRGQDEQLAKDVSDVQRRQKDMAQGIEERVRKFEPSKVIVDGREFSVEPAEKRDYEAALAIFRKPDFGAAQGAFIDFVRRYPQSGYNPSALFWLGNAQFATRNYIEAVGSFRSQIALAPDHPKSSEAALSIANSQVEMKDNRAARKTLEDLIKVYPRSEAAVAANERLARLPK